MKNVQIFFVITGLFLFLLPETAFADTIPSRLTTAHDFTTHDQEYEAAIVMDVNTHKILFEKNADELWTAASITKLIGALTFIDRQSAWDAVVSIKEQDEVGGGRLRVDDGATMTIQDLMYSSITGSANNAATALARLSGLGMQGFVQAMNQKAKSLGCTKSIFTDPSGMDVGNTITARELLKIASAAYADERIQKPASTSSYTFKILNTGEAKTIKNTNELLLDPDNGLYVTGGKTGFLYESRNNFVYKVRKSKDDAQSELLIVVLGAYTRFDLFDIAHQLADWSWASYTWDSSLASNLPTPTPTKPTEDPDTTLKSVIINGTLIKTSDSPAVWYVYNQKKYVLLDGVFLDAYFPTTPIITVTKTVAESLADDRPYTFDDGILLKSKSSPVVYYMNNGYLRPIVSASAFERQGFDWDDIYITSQFVLDGYKIGSLVTADSSLNTQLTIR
ncbi:serine hydrolase [Patescibacteria group bacterium]|nr:serine hydrolase [Patescibacteria group bacterium]